MAQDGRRAGSAYRVSLCSRLGVSGPREKSNWPPPAAHFRTRSLPGRAEAHIATLLSLISFTRHLG